MLGLRALATGLPTAFFVHPRRAMAQQASTLASQFLILATSTAGDPFNANGPGTYDVAGATANTVVHANTTAMAPAPFFFAGKQYTAAAPWATLTSDTLARTALIHHGTLTPNHGEQGRVMKLMGAVRRGDMATSMFASHLAQTLGTVQPQPLALYPGEITQYQGQYQPTYTPMGIKSLLAGNNSPLQSLQMLRDAELNRLYGIYKQSGSTTAERSFIDNLASSQAQIRKIADGFASDLNLITDNGPDSQALMAVLLAKMNVAPIFTIHVPFGGDNHSDTNWQTETSQTVSGMATINLLMQRLKTYDMQDKINFAILNVFGRTLAENPDGTSGRGHNPAHHLCMMVGKNVAPALVGGVGSDGSALSFDSSTGQVVNSGGVALIDSLAAVGKTLGRALGVDAAIVDDQITDSTAITAALV